MLMAIVITVVSVLIAAFALVSSIAGHHAEFAAGLSAEVKRRHVLEQQAETGCAAYRRSSTTSRARVTRFSGSSTPFSIATSRPRSTSSKS
jgi:hypothetical protein